MTFLLFFVIVLAGAALTRGWNSRKNLLLVASYVIHAEVDRMAGLINNLLNISKLETGAIALAAARVNVHDLLAGAFEAQRQNAVGKGLKFRINVPVNLGLAALDEQANPSYDRQLGARLVEAGAHIAAMTPGQLAGWLADKLQ